MRALLLSATAVLFVGCGGNWSNSDLAFSNALPRRDDLKSKLPTGSTAQPLTGVGTRRDELMVGEASGAWAQTRKAATDYNGLLDSLLGLVDQVRQYPPTTRTTDSRTWGPYNDDNNPGRQVQIVINRVDETTFAWHVDSRPNNGEFVQMLTGNFKATDTARRGQGTVDVAVKDFRDVVKVDDGLNQIDHISIGYVTDMFPKRVEMQFTFRPGSTLGFSAFGYTAREQQDGSGAMRFVYDTPGPEIEQLEINAAWKPTGEGKSVGTIQKGTYAGYFVTECWNKGFTVSYFAEAWPGGATNGSLDDCVTFDGL